MEGIKIDIKVQNVVTRSEDLLLELVPTLHILCKPNLSFEDGTGLTSKQVTNQVMYSELLDISFPDSVLKKKK